MEKIQRASVFKFEKKKAMLVHSVSRLKIGGGIATDPYIWLDVTASEEEVADAIFNALNRSKDGLPTPDNWKLFQQSFLEAIGLKKQRDLQDHVVSVEVLQKDNKIFFTPMANMGSRGGFVNVSNEKIEIPAASSVHELNKALQEALDKSE